MKDSLSVVFWILPTVKTRKYLDIICYQKWESWFFDSSGETSVNGVKRGGRGCNLGRRMIDRSVELRGESDR